VKCTGCGFGAAGDSETDGDDTLSLSSLSNTRQDDDSLLALYTHPPEIVNPTITVGPGRIDLGAARKSKCALLRSLRLIDELIDCCCRIMINCPSPILALTTFTHSSLCQAFISIIFVHFVKPSKAYYSSTQHPFTHSHPFIHSSIFHPFIHSPTHPLIHPFIHSSTHHPFTHSSIIQGYSSFHPFTHSPTHPFIHSSIQAFIHSCIHAFIHSSIHPFIHSSTHPLIRSSIHPFIHSVRPGIHARHHPFLLSSIHSFMSRLTDEFIAVDYIAIRQLRREVYRLWFLVSGRSLSPTICILQYTDRPFVHSSIHPSIHPFIHSFSFSLSSLQRRCFGRY
jgi:hypothetical protein